MKNISKAIKTKISLLLLAVVFTGTTYGATYTAVNSGNFSASATWAGSLAPLPINLLDTVVIPAGITVNLNSSYTLNGTLAALKVDGNLNSTNSSTLTVNIGNVMGAGNIVLETVAINVAAALAFTGNLTATTLNSTTGFASAAHITVEQTLNLTAGTLSTVTGGSLALANNGTIIVSGGLLAAGAGGTVSLTNNYNVTYNTASSIAGIELTGSGLQNVTINPGAANTVTLATNLTVNGTLALTSGVLIVAANNLTLNGTIASVGTGSITTTALSNISINSAGGTTDALTFSGLTSAVNNLTVNVGAGNQAHIAGNVDVNGTLQLNSGALNFSGADLTIGGNVSGAGTLSANNQSDLTINSLTAAASTLTFTAGAQNLRNFTVTAGLSNTPSLGSDLTVAGTLALTTTSNLNLNGHTLTLGATSLVTAGTGSIVATNTSGLTVNATTAIAALPFTGSIGNLTINSTGTTSVGLANNSTVGMLSLQSGTLNLNGHDLIINGNVAGSGTGTISTDSTSNLTIATPASTSGELRFATLANTVGNLTVNVAGSGSAAIGTMLHVRDTLHFIAGKLAIGANALIIGATGMISGASTTSYISTAANGYLQMNLTAGLPGMVNFPVGTTLNYSPANVLLNAGSASGQIKVGVVSNVLAQGTSGVDLSASQPLVDATWNVASNISSNLNLNLQLMWTAAMEVNSFNANAAYISHYTNGAWDVSASSVAVDESAGLFSLIRTGLTSLSPFTVFDQNTATPVAEVKNDIAFSIYPNPANDNLVIVNSTFSTEPVIIDVYTITGQLVANYKLNSSTMSIPVSDLQPGSYMLKFYNSKVSSTKQFIKI